MASSLKKKLEMESDDDGNKAKRSKSSKAEDDIIERLLGWWFHCSGLSRDEQGTFEKEKQTAQTYSEAARSRWFANGAAQKVVDKFIHEQWGQRVLEASRWCSSMTTGTSPSLITYDKPAWMVEWSDSANGSLALVILLDQFSRHMKRQMQVEPQGGATVDTVACSLVARMEVLSRWKGSYLSQVSILSENMSCGDNERYAASLVNSGDKYDCDSLKSNELVFLLMPFRHDINASSLVNDMITLNQRKEQLQMVMNEVDAREKLLLEEVSLLQRFRKQNTRAMNIIDDTCKSPMTKSASGEASGGAGGGDKSTAWMSEYDDLLERLPLATNEEEIESESLVKTVDLFLSKWFVKPIENKEDVDDSGSFSSSRLLPLSLSGGVDSMVLLKILSLPCLREKFHYDVLSLHVDYGNRPEASKESEFVQLWGRASHQGAIVEVLEIGGGRNNGTMSRDEFEKTSRVRRFNFYKTSYEKHMARLSNKKSEVEEEGLRPTMASYEEMAFAASSHLPGSIKHYSSEIESVNSSCLGVGSGCGVMLAHHLGDVEENVLSNVLHGCMPDKLSGMKEVGIVEGCQVWRPLLPWRKDEILRFAHKYGIPYFLDSTPSWSTRYALRNTLLPAIANTYGDGAHRNLACLAKDSDLLHEEIQALIVDPFMKRVKFHKLGVEVKGATEFAGGNSGQSGGGSVFWWKLVLMPLLHSIGNPMVSEKSLQVLLRRLKGNNQAPMKPLSSNKVSKKKKNFQSEYQLQKYEESKLSKSKKTDVKPSSTTDGERNTSNTAAPVNGWLELRKEYVTYLQNGNLFIFKQSLLPSRSVKEALDSDSEKRGKDSLGKTIDYDILRNGNASSEKSSRKSNAPLLHVAEGSVFPMPPLLEVLTFLRNSHSSKSTTTPSSQPHVNVLRSDPVRWGPWQIVASIKSPDIGDLLDTEKRNNSNKASFQTCDIIDGKILLKHDSPDTWLQVSKAKKQAQLLPLEQFPCLSNPILGEEESTTCSSTDCFESQQAEQSIKASKHDKSLNSFSDLNLLMNGKFSYSVLLPLSSTNQTSEMSDQVSKSGNWEWSLCSSCSAKLLPFRHLDPTLKRLVPLLVPTRTSRRNDGCSTEKDTFYCIVDVEYEFIE